MESLSDSARTVLAPANNSEIPSVAMQGVGHRTEEVTTSASSSPFYKRGTVRSQRRSIPEYMRTLQTKPDF